MLNSINKVAIIDHTESLDGRVSMLKGFFEKQKKDVTVITSDFSHYTKKKIKQENKSFIYLHTIPYKKNISLKRIFSHIYFAKKVYQLLLKSDYDMVWLLLPPNYLLKEVVKAKKTKKFILFADLQDLWPESLPINSKKIKNSFVARLWSDIRDSNLDLADVIITECNAYKRFLKNINNDSYTLYLAKDNILKFPTINLDNHILKIAYLGSINNIIDIDSITFSVKKLALNYKIIVEIIGDGEKRKELINALKTIPNVEVNFRGKIFDDELKDQILSQCNFGINMMKSDVVVGFTMKSLDYLRNGVFLLNNIQNDTADLVDDEKIGINIDKGFSNYLDVQSIIEQSYNIKERERIIRIYNDRFSKLTFYSNLTNIIEDNDL